MIPIAENIFIAKTDATRICSVNLYSDCIDDDIECLFDGGLISIYRKKENFILIILIKIIYECSSRFRIIFFIIIK